MKKLLLLFCFYFVSASFLLAQFGVGGNMLKKKAEKLIKDKLIEKAEDKEKSYDTLSFNYAIAFLDKTESFENQQKGERLIRTANFLIQDDEPATDLEEARDLYDFGRLNYAMGNQFLAESYLNVAKLKYESINAEKEPNYLKSIGVLGLLYSDMGRFSKAEEFTEKAKSGWLELKGAESKGFLAELNNKVVLQMNLGNYIEAEKLLLELADKIKALNQTNSLPYAILLNNQAILYQYMGRSETALNLINDCIATATIELSENSSTFLQFLTNKAILQQENKQLDEAEQTFDRVLKLQASRAKFNKKSDPDYAHMQSNIAALYAEKEEYEKAEAALKTALDIYITKFGTGYLPTAETQSDLGNLYRFLGENEKAKKLLQDALYTKERKLSETHPKVIDSKEDLALWYWQNKEINTAKTYYQQVMSVSLDFILQYFPALSEAEKTKYWEQMSPRFFRFYNFALSEYHENLELLEDLIRYRLATKGILLTSSTALQNALFRENKPAVQALYLQWVDQKQQLANAYSLSEEAISEQNINVDSLEKVANLSEKQLSEQSNAFSEAFAEQNTDYKQLQSKLKPGEVLIEVIQYPKFTRSLSTENAYAFLIFKSGVQKPEVIVNTNGNLLDGRYYAYFNNVIQQKLEDKYSYEQYWQPISSAAAKAGKIYFSPDGIYNQINLNVIKKPDGKYVIQTHDIRYLGHPNDINYQQSSTDKPSRLAFLMGDPQFNNSEITQLPGTRKEVESIAVHLAKELSVEKYLESKATEANLKKVKSPKILHLASHGFFLQDKQLQNNLMGIQLQYIRQNPLLRSGILLSGVAGENSGAAGQSFTQSDNGILTAYEAINLNLRSTEMVVLSACETGKGDVKAGEGVYGLQRAFIMAGARSLIMSMWKVDDIATQKLMTQFYKNRYDTKDVATSFRNAQLSMLEEYQHPYYWGGFMLFSR